MKVKMKTCLVDGCTSDLYSKDFCQKHFKRWKKTGSPLTRTMYDPNEFVDHGDYWEIKLYDRKGNYKVSAKIDPEDVEKCREYKWFLREGKGLSYVVSDTKSLRILLHRFVLNVIDPSIEVDHIYSDTLDNRKSQLRECDRAQQMWNSRLAKNNTSGVKNVNWHKVAQKWHAQIVCRGIRYSQHFDDFDEASQYIDKLSVKLHGEFLRRK